MLGWWLSLRLFRYAYKFTTRPEEEKCQSVLMKWLSGGTVQLNHVGGILTGPFQDHSMTLPGPSQDHSNPSKTLLAIMKTITTTFVNVNSVK